MSTYSIGDLVSESWVSRLASGWPEGRKDMPEPRVGLVIGVNEKEALKGEEENNEAYISSIVVLWSDQTKEKYPLWRGSLEQISYLPIIG